MIEFAAMVLAGTALSIYGQQKQAESEANQANRAALIKEIEAQETLSRAKLNEQQYQMDARRFAGDQAAHAAAGGALSTTGSPLLALENTTAFYRRQIEISNREAQFRADQLLRQGADFQYQSSDMQRAAPLRQAGTILTAGANFYQAFGTSNSESGKPKGRS